MSFILESMHLNKSFISMFPDAQALGELCKQESDQPGLLSMRCPRMRWNPREQFSPPGCPSLTHLGWPLAMRWFWCAERPQGLAVQARARSKVMIKVLRGERPCSEKK